MERIRVVARRSGNWWAIEVPEHPGVYSQARRIDQVAAMAADALSLWLKRKVSPEDIDVKARPGEPLEDVFESARTARGRAEEARANASAAAHKAVECALEAGLPLRDIGQLLGVTHQRVAAIARELKAA